MQLSRQKKRGLEANSDDKKSKSNDDSSEERRQDEDGDEDEDKDREGENEEVKAKVRLSQRETRMGKKVKMLESKRRCKTMRKGQQ